MGQYYRVVVDKHIYTPSGGVKLCEHAYKHNDFVNAVAEEIYLHPVRVGWVGDYADTEKWAGMLENLGVDFSEVWGEKVSRISNYDDKKSFSCKGKYLVNHSKREYYDMDNEIYESGHKPQEDAEFWDMHALPLLTAIGNGEGSGDYFGVGTKDVGKWAGDLLSIEDTQPDGYKLVVFGFDYM